MFVFDLFSTNLHHFEEVLNLKVDARKCEYSGEILVITSPKQIREGQRSLSMVTYLADYPKLIGSMVDNLQ
jgi:hypothetical protein